MSMSICAQMQAAGWQHGQDGALVVVQVLQECSAAGGGACHVQRCQEWKALNKRKQDGKRCACAVSVAASLCDPSRTLRCANHSREGAGCVGRMIMTTQAHDHARTVA